MKHDWHAWSSTAAVSRQVHQARPRLERTRPGCCSQPRKTEIPAVVNAGRHWRNARLAEPTADGAQGGAGSAGWGPLPGCPAHTNHRLSLPRSMTVRGDPTPGPRPACDPPTHSTQCGAPTGAGTALGRPAGMPISQFPCFGGRGKTLHAGEGVARVMHAIGQPGRRPDEIPAECARAGIDPLGKLGSQKVQAEISLPPLWVPSPQFAPGSCSPWSAFARAADADT